MEIGKVRKILKKYENACNYILIKVRKFNIEKISLENKEPSISCKEGNEYAVFVFNNNNFGFSCSSNINDLEKCIRRAIKMSNIKNGKKKYKTPKQVKGKFEVKEKIKWDNISYEEKLKLLEDVNERLKASFVTSTKVAISNFKEEKLLLSNIGLEVSQSNVFTGIGIRIYGKSNGIVEEEFFSKELNGGFEVIKEADIENVPYDLVKKLREKFYSKTIIPGKYNVILDNTLTGTLFHEALGHALEGDTIRRNESVFANMLGKKVATSNLNVFDVSIFKNSKLFRWDDEGVENKKVNLIQNGIIKSFLIDIESAIELGLSFTGNARCQDYFCLPLPRMSNLVVDKGNYEKDELFKMKEGIYLVGSKGGVTNTKTGEFEFYPREGYLIKKGEIVRRLKNISIVGNIKEFLKNIVKISNDLKMDEEASLCFKDGQYVKTVSFAPHIRVRGVYIGGYK